MPRRERLQDARRLRVSFATDDRRWRACRAAHRRLLSAVPKRICHASLPSVRLLCIHTFVWVSDDNFPKDSVQSASRPTTSTRSISKTRVTYI
jgi:hypothetical protein